jgi:hypothetical protein
MAGLIPTIHVFLASRLQDVDARHKAGHDERMSHSGFTTCRPALKKQRRKLR